MRRQIGQPGRFFIEFSLEKPTGIPGLFGLMVSKEDLVILDTHDLDLSRPVGHHV